MFVRCVAILSAIIVTSWFNYIPFLQLNNARVTRPFLFMRRGGRARLGNCIATLCPFLIPTLNRTPLTQLSVCPPLGSSTSVPGSKDECNAAPLPVLNYTFSGIEVSFSPQHMLLPGSHPSLYPPSFPA